MKSSKPNKFIRSAILFALAGLGLATGACAGDRQGPVQLPNLTTGISGGKFTTPMPFLVLKAKGYVVPELVLSGVGKCTASLDFGNGQPPYIYEPKWGQPINVYGGLLMYKNPGSYTFTVKGAFNVPKISAPPCAGTFSQTVEVVYQK